MPLLYFLPRLPLLEKSESQPFLVPILGEGVLRNRMYFFATFGILLTFVNPYPLWEIGKISLPVSVTGTAGYAGAGALTEGKLPCGNLPSVSRGMDTQGLTYYLIVVPFSLILSGTSTWSCRSPWTHYPELRPLKKCFMVLFPGFCLAVVTFVRSGDVRNLALASGTVIVASQMWKEHAPEGFILWSLPFLLVGSLLPSSSGNTSEKVGADSSDGLTTGNEL